MGSKDGCLKCAVNQSFSWNPKRGSHKDDNRTFVWFTGFAHLDNLLVPRTEHHLSSFKCGFLNIFSRQNLLRRLSRLLFLLRWNKYGARKCLKNHIPFDF